MVAGDIFYTDKENSSTNKTYFFFIFIHFDHCIVLEEFVNIIVFFTTSPSFSEPVKTISYLSLLKVHVVVNTNFLLLNQTDQTLATTKRH